MKPIKAKDLLELDKRLQVVKLQSYPIPEQVIYQAAKNDYSEIPIHEQEIPSPQKCGEWIVDTLLKNDRGHYGCYSSDTQVLTETGWVYWSEVNEKTVLAAYDIKTGVVNFETPSAVQRWDYNGKMYHLEGQALDFMVSPDHRMIVQSRKKDGTWTESYDITAENVYNKPVRYITTGNLSVNERLHINTPVDNSSFWSLVGFWIGDGNADTTKNTIQFHLKVQKKIDYLFDITKELGIDCYITKENKYVVSLENIGNWFKENCLTEDKNKKFPDNYLRLEKDCVFNLFDGLKNSDGTIRRKTWAYSTTSKVLSEQMQALAALNDLKFTCNIEERDNKNHNDLYVLRLTDIIYPRVEISQNSRSVSFTENWIDYVGQIHCATVSTGALIVRRNGKVAVCGNCLEHPQITFSVSGFVHNVMVQARTHRIGTSWDCLAPESKITVKIGSKVKTKTIAELYEMYNRGDTLPLVRNLNEDRGYFDYAKIGQVFKNKEKDLYLVTLSDGKQLKCSMDHKIFTEHGWKRLKDLSVGDKVACNGVSLPIIEEARQKYTNPICASKEHKSLRTHYVEIFSIEFLRTDITYDIEVDGKYHNFVCDGVVVHNCQSQRYTGRRVVKVAKRELDVEDVFYVRPEGFYTNRKGKKYEWTEEHRQRKLGRILSECEEYADYYEQGMCEEHIRDYLPQAIRQNFVVSFNLRSVLHFMDLRSKMDAQLEIQALCDALIPELQKWAPNVWDYYKEKRMYKAKLAP